MIIFKVAWRNLWRNPLRSLVLTGAIFTGLVAGILAMGFVNGFIDQRFENAIEGQVSHIQVHSPEFIQERETSHILSVDTGIINKISGLPGIRAVTSRSRVNCMIASANNTAGVMVTGVMPDMEAKVTTMQNSIIEGNYFENTSQNELLIGKKLAERLNVKIGSRIVLTFSDVQNELVTAAFRVQGIYKSAYEIQDERNVYVPLNSLNKYLGIEDGMHEVAILLSDIDQLDEKINEIKVYFENDVVRSFYEVSPELAYLSEAGGVVGLVFIIIILTGLAFGVLNTMLMTIFERTREIGMLMAIGMNKTKVFKMIMLESTILSVSGGIFGLLGGGLMISWVGSSGVDFGVFGDAMASYGFGTKVYPSLETEAYFYTMGLVILMAIIATIYPSIKAIKLVPVEAVRQ